jgi:hypothetical protein
LKMRVRVILEASHPTTPDIRSRKELPPLENQHNYSLCPTYQHHPQPLPSPEQSLSHDKNDNPTSVTLKYHNPNFDIEITLSDPHKTSQSPSSSNPRERSPYRCHITY